MSEVKWISAMAPGDGRVRGRGGLMPEQVGDADYNPECGLVRGRPSGSAMSLVWAHAEYLKLVRSIQDRALFDLPPQTVARDRA